MNLQGRARGNKTIEIEFIYIYTTAGTGRSLTRPAHTMESDTHYFSLRRAVVRVKQTFSSAGFLFARRE
jgi:hypothetical protein